MLKCFTTETYYRILQNKFAASRMRYVAGKNPFQTFISFTELLMPSIDYTVKYIS